MFKDQICKVTLSKVTFGGDGAEHEIAMRFDFSLSPQLYEKIDKRLGKLAKDLLEGDGMALPQLQWNFDSMPCNMVYGPTRDDVAGKPSELCHDLGAVQFDKKLMLITRKDKGDEEAAPELFLYATTRIKKTRHNTKFATDFFKVDAYCRIRTSQTTMEDLPNEESEEQCP